MITAIVSDLREIILHRFKTAPLHELLALSGRTEVTEPRATSARFEIVDDEIVIDHSTGLTWLRGFVPGGKRSYGESIKAAAALNIHGRKWRAPTIRERLSINDYERHEPAIDTNFFRSESSGWEWTSTPLASSPGDYAWHVYFYGGGASWSDQNGSGLVRAVCASQ